MTGVRTFTETKSRAIPDLSSRNTSRPTSYFFSRISRSFMLLILAFLLTVAVIVSVGFYMSERNFIISNASEKANTIFNMVKNTFYYHIMPYGDITFFKAYYEHLNETSPFLKIRVIRGESVTRQFGRRPEAEPAGKEDFEALQGKIVEKTFVKGGRYFLEKIYPLRAERQCIECHYVMEGEINGALSVTLDITPMFLSMKKREKFILGLIGITFLLFTGIVYGIFHIRVEKPLMTFIRNCREIAKGNFDVKVNLNNDDEMGELATTFNYMVDNIKQKTEALIHSEKLAVMGSLAAGLAHRLNNPLAVLRVKIEYLMETAHTPEEKEELKKALTKMEELSETIKKILEFSRRPPDRENVINIGEIVEECIEFISPLAARKNVKIKAQIEKIGKVRGKKEELHQVFLSILMNAIEAIEEKGEGKGEVVIKSFVEDNRYVTLIRDTGTGIPEEHLPFIFDPFFTTKPYHRGTGLGLTIAQSVIKTMGGSIYVESHRGTGSEFRIEVPLEGTS